MSQVIFKNPSVSVTPALTGTGNGNLTVDKLTHFTIAQVYTVTCVAKSPDTVFSVSGSLDGSIGLALVAQQFFDSDLKVFFTIQQGVTPFEVGDQFTFTVVNGTDLNQQNIDTYDELPQKNFGVGLLGNERGDHSLRYSDSAVPSYLYLQDLFFQAIATGSTGDAITLEFAASVAAVSAFLVAQDLTFTAVTPGVAGNSITFEYVPSIFAIPTVTVTGSAINVTLDPTVTTATQIKTALDGTPAAVALISTAITGVGSNPQTGTPNSATALAGGADAIGLTSPAVSVIANAIKVNFQISIHTTTQIKSALDGSGPAAALISTTIIGNGANPQSGPVSATNLSGGRNKWYSFNHNEQSDSSNFVEGNASVHVKDLAISGKTKHSGASEFDAPVILNDTASGFSIPNLQQYVNNLIQDRKITYRTSDSSKLTWSKPSLSFLADLVFDFNDTGLSNTVSVANSPVTLNDGDNLYVLLNRNSNAVLVPVVAASVPKLVNAFRIATRHGNDLILADNTLLRDGKSADFGEGGSGNTVHTTFYDPLSTTLPTGATATFDSVAVSNNDLVYFDALASGNHAIYKATGVGTSIVWIAQTPFLSGLNPSLGEQILVDQGVKFGLQTGIYNGSNFTFNDTVRYFNGTDFWEITSPKAAVITDASTNELFHVNVSGSENIVVDFSVVRGSSKANGTIFVVSDGTSAQAAFAGASISDTGVTFDASVTSGVLSLTYTATSTGISGTAKYIVRRWSDSGAGPTGITSYSGAPPSDGGAAGSPGEIQYNAAGELAADGNFTWNSSTKVLGLGALSIGALSAPIVLTDNTASPTTIVSYDSTLYPSTIIEYSELRNGTRRTGRMIVSTNGTDIAYEDDFVTATSDGIVLNAVISGSNVLIQFTSTSTGFNGSFKYTARQWA